MSNDSRFVITGASGGSSPNRLEINDFVRDDKFFSLYIQALQVMSENDQGMIQSFFSIAGIHGLPSVAWDDAVGQTPFDPNSGQWGGYCTHGSVVFPTWHRPYVMLYEQILQQRAREISLTYTVDTEDWNQAADNLRQPFWDWALNAVPPDEVIKQKQVTITGKDGKQVLVDNPLYHYQFHPIDPSFQSPYSNWPTTLRQPTSGESNATDDVAMLQNVMASAQSNITSSTYNMLTRIHTWPAFSNHTPGDGGSQSNSIEGIHDGIHVDVGGGGQMSDPSVAAYDPIFFLHHSNVDRMLSLWSALNPGVWVTPSEAEDGGSFTSPPGTPYDEDSALTPFWNAQTTFWASSSVTDTSKLGYTYPDFNGLDISNRDAVMTAISDRVNQLYGNSVFGTFAAVPSAISGSADTAKKASAVTKKMAVASHHHNPLEAGKKVLAALSSHRNPVSLQHPLSAQVAHHAQGHMDIHPSAQLTVIEQSSAVPDHGMWDWTARIEFKKYELGMSFSVLIFLGEVPENPQEWRISTNYVGGSHAFVNSAASSCANCRNQQELVVEGFVHLNHAIVKLSGLGSLEPNVIKPYLTHNLHWRVQKPNREAADLQSLEVAVIATPLSYPPGSAFPVPGNSHRHNGITYGKPGGSRHA